MSHNYTKYTKRADGENEKASKGQVKLVARKLRRYLMELEGGIPGAGEDLLDELLEDLRKKVEEAGWRKFSEGIVSLRGSRTKGD